MTGRTGIFGIGLAAYWPQFPGMKGRLEGYERAVEDREPLIQPASGQSAAGRLLEP
jgi:hypothetical protein